MVDRVILPDPVLQVIYLVMPQGHRVAREVDRARDLNGGGHLSIAQTREVASVLEHRCRSGHQVAALAALYAARELYDRALAVVDAPDRVSVYRWDPSIDGPEPPFRCTPPDRCQAGHEGGRVDD